MSDLKTRDELVRSHKERIKRELEALKAGRKSAEKAPEPAAAPAPAAPAAAASAEPGQPAPTKDWADRRDRLSAGLERLRAKRDGGSEAPPADEPAEFTASAPEPSRPSSRPSAARSRGGGDEETAAEWMDAQKGMKDLMSKLAGQSTTAGGGSKAGGGGPGSGGGAVAEGFLQLDDLLNFESFVVGPANRFAQAAAKAVAESPAKAYNPLFIYGDSGLGKTHLLNAVGNEILRRTPKAQICYVTSEKFINGMMNSIREDTLEAFRAEYRNMDVLLMDDIQFIARKERTQEEFFHTFNSLYNAQKQIVITSDRPPKEIELLEDRLRSRFEGGLITDIQLPDLETRLIIMRQHAKREDILVQDEVLVKIAESFNKNIRELEGAFKKITAYSKMADKDITAELLAEVFPDLGAGGGADDPAMAPFKEELSGWQTSGFTVDYLESALGSKSVPELQSLFEETRGQITDIDKIKRMMKFLKAPDEAGGAEKTQVEDGLATIQEQMKDPRQAAEIKKKFTELGKLINEIKRKSGKSKLGFVNCENCGATIPGKLDTCPKCKTPRAAAGKGKLTPKATLTPKKPALKPKGLTPKQPASTVAVKQPTRIRTATRNVAVKKPSAGDDTPGPTAKKVRRIVRRE